MEGIHSFLDMPSPTNSSYQYVYGDADRYLDGSRSDTHSSVNSPYGMSFPGDFAGSNPYPSPGREHDGEDGSESPKEPQAAAQQEAKPAKRKRENRYKNAPPSVLSRRRAQNRASQRAYRERKDQRIKDLEQMLNDAKQRNDVLSQAYAELHAEYVKLKASQLNEAAYATTTELGGYVDPTMDLGAGSDQRLDMNMYVYSDMANYPL